ncbi:MAG TPA: asparagine synthetase B, partial [Thermoanaerobaculia bacterium]|nr:asparagine synthetase B [Thermoanaerobaculia bacterium]
MCGLAGIWKYGGAPRDALRGVAGAMAARLRHRGPDDEGCWIDEQQGIAFGFRRLAILDLTSAGAQPMHSASGRYVIVFNGEIYNHIRLREELARENAVSEFRGHCDVETVLAAIEAWGLEGALRRFIGMFAFALWDRKEHALSLVRDRAGVKPLYYAATPAGVLFASEPKAFLADPDFNPRLSRDAVALYARLDYVPAPYAIFEDVRKLP